VIAGWETVVAMAETLPGAERSTSYGRPALKVRGKAFAASGKQDDHFVLLIDVDTVDMLMETEPDVFFQTDHYRGWPAVLVRYAAADRERVRALVEQAWAARASLKQRAARASA
jgi:hypothetical protein